MSEQTLPIVPEPAQAEPDSLYRFSTWLHVGHGAETCAAVNEETGVVACTAADHFHAWLRLPNDFQKRDMVDHATAAAAAKRRQMRLDGTAINIVLEEGLERIRDEEGGTERIIDELLGATLMRDYMDSVSETRDIDDPHWEPGEGETEKDAPKLYGTIDTDIARHQRLLSENVDAESNDEMKELIAHIAAYQADVQGRLEGRRLPRRDALELQSDDELVDALRKRRIEAAGQDEFMHHYSAHEWLACTYRDRSRDSGPVFRDLGHMENAAPEVLYGIREAFNGLERTASAVGN